jgi:DHA1 family bicyclomycin/chloramphenicol resistance-like MFS transporter
MQYGSGIVSSALVGCFADGTPWPMGWVIAVAGGGSFLCARLITPAAAHMRRREMPGSCLATPPSR